MTCAKNTVACEGPSLLYKTLTDSGQTFVRYFSLTVNTAQVVIRIFIRILKR